MTKYARINFYMDRTTLAYPKHTKGATRKRSVFRTLAGRLQRTRSYAGQDYLLQPKTFLEMFCKEELNSSR